MFFPCERSNTQTSGRLFSDRSEATMKKNYLLQGLVIVGVVLTLLVNYLATAGVLNGVTPPEISDALMTKFMPANYAFSIWSIIYTFVIGLVIYQALPSQRDNPKLAGVHELFIASCALNILWTFAWHYEFYFLSLIFMVGILLTMIADLCACRHWQACDQLGRTPVGSPPVEPLTCRGLRWRRLPMRRAC